MPSTNWARDRLLRAAAEDLVDADDAAVAAKASELHVDERELRAFLFDARRRRH